MAGVWGCRMLVETGGLMLTTSRDPTRKMWCKLE